MQKTYAQLRSEIAEMNENLIGTILNPEEKKLDERLKALKLEFARDCDNLIPYDMPVISDVRIHNSKLYDFCRRLPKGSDLHVHGTALLPAGKLIDFLLTRDDIFIDTQTLVLQTAAQRNENSMLFKAALEHGLISRPLLINEWTVLGGKDSPDIWRYFEDLFVYTDALDRDMDILESYYLYAFTDYIKCGIIHIEIHILLYDDFDQSLETLETIRRAYYKAKEAEPEFVVSIIGSSMKMDGYSVETSMQILENVRRLQESLKDESDGQSANFVLGFDLINEEDTSRPLKEYAEQLIAFKEKYPDFEFFLHCGESLNPRNDNLIDAYLIGATRVGHGTNLYRYPHLLKCYADKEICLESCLISNQTLRYTSDIRLHPSAEYLKRGVSIALCSDDPIFQENEQLTDDFFAAVVCWDLGIAEVKQLGINSVTYSGLDEKRKTKLLRAYKNKWNSFVQQMNEALDR